MLDSLMPLPATIPIEDHEDSTRHYDANDLVVGVEFLNISNRASKEQLGSIQFQLA